MKTIFLIFAAISVILPLGGCRGTGDSPKSAGAPQAALPAAPRPDRSEYAKPSAQTRNTAPAAFKKATLPTSRFASDPDYTRVEAEEIIRAKSEHAKEVNARRSWVFGGFSPKE